MEFTKETYRQNLKLVNNLWMEAVAKDREHEQGKLKKERDRIIKILNNWSDDNEDIVWYP